MHRFSNNNTVLEAQEYIRIRTVRKVNCASFCLRSLQMICSTFMVIFFRCLLFQKFDWLLQSTMPNLLRLSMLHESVCVPCCESSVVIKTIFSREGNLAMHKH